MMTETRPAWQRWLPLILVAAGALAGLWLLRDTLTFEALRDNREALIRFRDGWPLATVVLFIAAYVGIVAFSLPGATIATLTGGFLFGLFPGAFYNVLGATLGAAAIFTVVRLGMGEALKARIDASDGAVRRISDGIRDNEVPMLLTMRLMPAIPFFIANLIPAFLGVATWRFVWTTFVGILPGGVVYTWVGSGLGEVFARGETPNLGILFEPQILAPILALVALSLAPVVLKAVRRA
jgi:uncharacterized membrane protein YdjX (TVP38/TMEM64 family)